MGVTNDHDELETGRAVSVVSTSATNNAGMHTDAHTNTHVCGLAGGNGCCVGWSRKKKILVGFGAVFSVLAAAVAIGVGVYYGTRTRVRVAFTQKSSSSASRRLKMTTLSSNGNNYYWPSSCVMYKPWDFEMKLVAVYLAENVDPNTQSNVGNTQMVWLNPECHKDISNCNVIPGSKHVISSFFNFSRPLAEVNAQLNSQDTYVSPGTYRYVRMEFCKGISGDTTAYPNVRFQAGNMTASHSYFTASCGITQQATEPLELKSGQHIVVNLAYSTEDLAGLCHGNTGQGCSSQGWCSAIPDFTPSASIV